MVDVGKPPVKRQWVKARELDMIAPGEKWDRWYDKWSAAKEEYYLRMAAGDTEGAWAIWSQVAERAAEKEDGSGGPGRHRFMKPQLQKRGRIYGEEKQGLRVRRLQRVERRLREAQYEGWGREGDVRANAQDVIKWFPELGKMSWEGDAILHKLDSMIEIEMEKEREARIGRWETRMENCERELIEWIRKEEDVEGWGLDRHMCAQEGAEKIRGDLQKLLCPEDYEKGGRGRQRRRNEARQRAKEVTGWSRLDKVRVKGEAIRQILRKGEGKASGVDQWKAEWLGDLPLEAYDALADLWHAILGGAPLPET